MIKNLTRELISALNKLTPRTVGYTLHGRHWRIPNQRRSIDRLMRFNRDISIGIAVQKICPDTNLILDIGANVGQSLMLYLSLFPNATYRGFEPNPICSSMVLRIIAENDLNDCAVTTQAIGKTLQIHSLKVRPSHLDDPMGTISKSCHSRLDKCIQVPVLIAPLRQIYPDLHIGKRTIIKVDVEGYEAEVLESLEAECSRKPTFIVEILGQWDNSDARQDSLKRINQWIERNDYRILDQNGVHKNSIDSTETNYIFVPSQDNKQLCT